MFAVHHRPCVELVGVELLGDHHRVPDRIFTRHHRVIDDLAQFVRAARFVSVVAHAAGVVERAERNEAADCQRGHHKQAGQYDGDQNHVGRAVRGKVREGLLMRMVREATGFEMEARGG